MELVYPPYPAPIIPRPTADHPSVALSPSVEMVPVVRPTGEVVAQAARPYVHGGSKLLHPVVHLHVINRKGELYLQRRSLRKRLLPGYWDTSVGGHVDYGEYISEALYRETYEELHLPGFNPVYLRTYVYENERESELVNVFACVGDFHPEPDPVELAGGRYWSMKEIEDCLGKSVLTPNFEGGFVQIRAELEALL